MSMSRIQVLTIAWLATALALALPALPGSAAEAVAIGTPFAADVAALTAAPHRVAGSPEQARALACLAGRLRAVGVANVVEQPFAVPRLVVKQCELELAGRKLPLQPLRPDGSIPPATLAEGLSGALLVAGKGSMEDFGERSPAGRIVVLDYNCGDAWLRAFRLGATAVIFTLSNPADSRQSLHTEAPVNLPRYFYAGNPADLKDGAAAVVRAAVTWERGQGRNVIGFIPGTAPVMQFGEPETLVLGVAADSFGEVPFLSPGARGAANCAALLEIAARLVKNPPKRNIAVVFFDAEAYGHAGASAFYRVLQKGIRLTDLEERKVRLADERAFVAAELAALAAVPAFAPGEENASMVVFRRLKQKADEHAFAINAVMEGIRKAQNLARLDLKAGRPPRQDDAALQARLDLMQVEKNQWNDLRRILVNPHDLAANPNAAAEPLAGRLRQTADELRADFLYRQAELIDLQASLDADQELDKILGGQWISLHASLMLGDTSPAWGVMIGGNSFLRNGGDLAGLYGKIQRTFRESVQAAGAKQFTLETVDGSANPNLFLAAPLIHPGEIAGQLGIYNVVLGTVQERMSREGTPSDTPAALRLDVIERQAADLAAVLADLGSQEGLSVRRAIVPCKNYIGIEWEEGGRGKIRGPTVSGRSAGSALPNARMPGAVVMLRSPPWSRYEFSAGAKYPGFCNYQLALADGNSGYAFGPLHIAAWNLRGFTVKFDSRGLPESASDFKSFSTIQSRQNLFLCQLRSELAGEPPLRVFAGGVVLPPVFDPDEIKVLNGRTNGVLEQDRSFVLPFDGVACWYTDRRVESVKWFGSQSAIGFGIGEETAVAKPVTDAVNAAAGRGRRPPNPYGEGFRLPGGLWALPATAERAAADYWKLNEFRLRLMRDRGIVNGSIEELHGRAEDLIRDAKAATNTGVREALAAASFLSEVPVYRSTRAALDDLVRAVLILLGLAIPFAFALERLLVGATNIYRQILWFCGFFSATFLILFAVHPAFAVSNQPLIIFLAFALIVLSSLVIFVIMQKFETELKVLQGMTSTVHSADVSRFGTMMAAMSMGISSMRRRPLRTALTSLTIILLTFTILNFASFDKRTGVVTLYEGPVPAYTGVLLHKVNWTSLPEALPDLLRGRWGGQAVIACRRWMPAGTTASAEMQGPLLSLPDGSRPFVLGGVVGLEQAELDRRPDLIRMLNPTGTASLALEESVFITKPLAARLGVNPGAPVLVGGLPLRLAGLVDPVEMERAKDMDDNTLPPVDFNAMKSSSPAAATSQQTTGEDMLSAAQNKTDWVKLPNDSVVFLSAANAKKLGASLRVVTLYTPDAGVATRIAEDASRMLPAPVFATRADGVYTHVLAPTLAAKGVKDLLFPIVLGGLVIFGTMLGSVADREKEIYTFSALGLAPAHVATLFFAEALVYSFIGGLGGYLLAQGVMKGLGLLAVLGWIKTLPEMNYSSVNAIVTILIVMLVVMVSALYPAFKASRSANPGVMRGWRPPAPVGDTFRIVFPFTVSQYDITGVMSFLKEHFDNYSDTSLGCFMARDAAIRTEGAGLGLDSHLALAPFDLGVTQDFHLASAPSEIPGIDEVKIEMTRRSGQRKDWIRLNKVFLGDLRRQFLIWRSLPHETMETYRARTLALPGADAADAAAAPAEPAAT